MKSKILELLYSWTVGLPEEVKIAEAYQMLKKQGEAPAWGVTRGHLPPLRAGAPAVTGASGSKVVGLPFNVSGTYGQEGLFVALPEGSLVERR